MIFKVNNYTLLREPSKQNLINFIESGYKYWLGLGFILAICSLSSTYKSFTAPSAVEYNQYSWDGPFDCDWYPSSTEECEIMLSHRLPLWKNGNGMNKRRWLFLGDSTMKRLFHNSPLRNHLVLDPAESLSGQTLDACWQEERQKGFVCKEKMGDRCKLNEFFDLPYAEVWKEPDHEKFEGPLKNGFDNHFCTDCGGCESNLLDCHLQGETGIEVVSTDLQPRNSNCERNHLSYGGFITVEFAKDVEIQTPRFSTTQENIASYMHQKWNTPNSPVTKEWGLPICVINTGVHDSLIEDTAPENFIENANWYLNLLVPQCAHIIWLSNTARDRENEHFNANKEDMSMSYDYLILNLIANSPTLHSHTSFINIFDSSIRRGHADHIHMADVWYERMGQWFITNFMT
jgi:hypothetical protein